MSENLPTHQNSPDEQQEEELLHLQVLEYSLNSKALDSGPDCWAPATVLWPYPGSSVCPSHLTEPRTSEQIYLGATAFAASGAFYGRLARPFGPHHAASHPAFPALCPVELAKGCRRSTALCCQQRSHRGKWPHTPARTCASSPAGFLLLCVPLVPDTPHAPSAASHAAPCCSAPPAPSPACFSFSCVQKSTLPVSELRHAFYQNILFWSDQPSPRSLPRHHQEEDNHPLQKKKHSQIREVKRVGIKFSHSKWVCVYHHILQRFRRIHPRIHQTASPATPSHGLLQTDGSCFLCSVKNVRKWYMIQHLDWLGDK